MLTRIRNANQRKHQYVEDSGIENNPWDAESD